MEKAFELLKQDHKKFKTILVELSETKPTAKKTRQDLLLSLKEVLKAHEKIEETLVYPLLEKNEKTKPTALEGYEEHRLADHLLEKLEDTEFDDETWLAKLKVLKESLEHHISEEEEVLFPDALKVLNKGEIEKLDQGVSQMKHNEQEA